MRYSSPSVLRALGEFTALTENNSLIPQGCVVGRILHAVGEGPDADKLADNVVNVGTVTFRPAIPYRKLSSDTVITHSTITAQLDSHGHIHPLRATADNTGSDAEDAIWLPVGLWTVSYSLRNGSLPGHQIIVTEAHTAESPLPLFASMDGAPEAGATYVTLQVPLNGTPGYYLVMGESGIGLSWAQGVPPETIAAAVEDYLTQNPPSAAPDASTTTKGLIEIATTAEAVAGTDTSRAVTPAGVAAAINAAGGSLDTEGVQDVVGAMVVQAGGTYDDGAGTITLPAGGGASTLVQVGTLTLPESPDMGESVTVLADETTALPVAAVTWDSGGAPSITSGRLLIRFVWSGSDWVGTYGLPIPDATTTTTTTPGTTTTTTTPGATTTTTTTAGTTTTTTTTTGGGGGTYAWARRITPEQTNPASSIGLSTTHTFTVTGTAGRLLVAGFSADKDAGVITVSAGWTLVAYNSGASVSGALAYRVATGSDDITWTLGKGTPEEACCDVHEFTGFTSPTVDVFATFPTPADDTTRGSLAVSAGNVTADAMVVAIAGQDTQNESAASGSTADSGYTMRSWNSSGGSADVTLLMATKAVSAGGSTATTFNFGGTIDQAYGIVAAFKG